MSHFIDYQLSDREFERLRGLVREHTAIELSDQKRQLIQSRYSKRLRALGLGSFDQYCDLVEDGQCREIGEFTSAITTNFTRFFRESHHFELLATLLTSMASDKKLRIWSAGCATGEEPCSIAVTLLENIPDIDNWDIKILATDIDAAALKIADEGIYAEDRVADVDLRILKRWFRRGTGHFSKRVRISDSVRKLISYRHLNLVESWPMRQTFDVIFCRNVIIYFGHETKKTLISRFADMQTPGGHLVMGHSENLASLTEDYEYLGDTVYRRR